MEKTLKEKLDQAPKAPGCYLFKDSQGFIIYVGKSKLIYNRVRQYFQKSNQTDERRQNLVLNIHDVEFLITETETDALIQEYRLIKTHKPWYNRQLKADRPPACLKITADQPYAALLIMEAQGARWPGDQVFGYFRSRDDAERALALLSRAFQTPVCGHSFTGRKREPCLRYHLQQCQAPCAGRADVDTYKRTIREVGSLLSGRRTAIFSRVKQQMEARAQELDFEGAASWRNLGEELALLKQRSGRLNEMPPDREVAVFLRAYGEARFSLFLVRQGVVVWREDFEAAGDQLAEEPWTRFLNCWAEGGRNDELASLAWLSRCLTDLYADRRFFVLPKRLTRERLTELINREYRYFIKER